MNFEAVRQIQQQILNYILINLIQLFNQDALWLNKRNCKKNFRNSLLDPVNSKQLYIFSISDLAKFMII